MDFSLPGISFDEKIILSLFDNFTWLWELLAIFHRAEFFSPWLPVQIKTTLSLLNSLNNFSFNISKLSINFSSIAVVIALLILLPTTKIFLSFFNALEIIVFNLAIFEEKQVTIILPFKSLNNLSNEGVNSDSEPEVFSMPALVESPIRISTPLFFKIS